MNREVESFLEDVADHYGSWLKEAQKVLAAIDRDIKFKTVSRYVVADDHQARVWGKLDLDLRRLFASWWTTHASLTDQYEKMRTKHQVLNTQHRGKDWAPQFKKACEQVLTERADLRDRIHQVAEDMNHTAVNLSDRVKSCGYPEGKDGYLSGVSQFLTMLKSLRGDDLYVSLIDPQG